MRIDCKTLSLSACLFALLCLSSVGYASQPSADVHFCKVLDFEDMRARDSLYVAPKQTFNLNAGEPLTVRMIYFLPNDRPFRQEVVDSMKVTIRQIQTFFASSSGSVRTMRSMTRSLIWTGMAGSDLEIF